MRLTVRVENLLNESYHEVWGFAAPGRAVYVGGSVALGGGQEWGPRTGNREESR